jgi:transporter family-2 protein
MGVVSPVVGVAVFTVALVSGQTVSSLMVDKWGLGPAGKRPITFSRLLSTIVAVAAVVLAVSDRWRTPTPNGWVWWGVALALLGGIAVAFQMAANGRIAKASGQPAIGAGVNFLGGTLLLSILIIANPSTGTHSFLGSEAPAWLYGGAIFGFIIVFNAAWSVRHLGILIFTIVSVSGQVMGAVIIDLVLPTAGVSVTLPLIMGSLLALVAVAIGVGSGLKSGRGVPPHAS